MLSCMTCILVYFIHAMEGQTRFLLLVVGSDDEDVASSVDGVDRELCQAMLISGSFKEEVCTVSLDENGFIWDRDSFSIL